MTDPYLVLGVTSGATDDEITKAYRKLAKRYHPDINPGPDAEKKMQEINAAYEQIQQMRKNGGAQSQGQTAGGSGYQSQAQSQYGYGYGYGGAGFDGDDPFQGFDPFGFGFGRQRQETHQDFTDVKLRAAQNYIRSQCWEEALNVLSEITTRNGAWYYLSALANGGMGNRITAMNHAQEAVRQEPGNTEYRRVLNSFQQGNFAYQNAGAAHGFTFMGGNNLICGLCFTWALCNCCTPGLCGGAVIH